MGSKTKTENMKEYQREYYLRNRKKGKCKNITVAFSYFRPICRDLDSGF
jgi:hypothetical protein